MARFLAIDWDRDHLHVLSANIDRVGSVRVYKAAMWKEPAPKPDTAVGLGERLRERLKQAGIAAAPVVVCVGRDRTIIKEVRHPPVPDTEEATLVRFQTLKELTDAPDDVVIDYVPGEINGHGNGNGGNGGERRATAMVVRREVLTTWQVLCQSAKLRLAGLTPRFFGLQAALQKVMGTTVVTPAPEPPDAAVCIAVLDEKWAEVCISEGGKVLLARAIPVGPSLAADLRRTLVVHNGQTRGTSVAAVYLAGLGVGDLRQRLLDLVTVPVHTFDPLGGEATTDLQPAERGAFAGALGTLLLWGRHGGKLPINFVAPRQPAAPAHTGSRYVRLALVASFTLVIGLAVLGRIVLAADQGRLDTNQTALRDVEKQLAETRDKVRKIKPLDDWDTATWLDELYALNARIPSVNELRMTSVEVTPLTRSEKQRFAGTVTMKGTLVSNKGRAPLDAFVNDLKAAGHYSTSLKVDKDTFTLLIQVERRGPVDYKEKLEVPVPAWAKKDKDKAGKTKKR